MTDLITTDLAPVPSRTAPSTFSSRLDTWLGKISAWTTEANALATGANTNATAAATQAGIATDQAAAAAASATAIGFKGAWADLTGSLLAGNTVSHSSAYWFALVYIADIEASTPSSGNTDWEEVFMVFSAYKQDVDAAGYKQLNTRFQDTAEVLQALGTVTTATAIDIESGNIASLTVGGAFTLSITNWAAAGNYSELLIMLTNGGAYTITWPTVNWLIKDGAFTTVFADNEITLQTSGTDFVFIWTVDGGTTLYGKIVR